ncbi:MAG: hypothetical protein AAFW70_30920, partial [Cyanobacteria bacterium J06635_10]
VKIQLSYSQLEDTPEKGNVENSVELGLLKIVLTGPVQFWSKKNILAFDFTKMRLSLSGLKLYQGYIRGGEEREKNFDLQFPQKNGAADHIENTPKQRYHACNKAAPFFKVPSRDKQTLKQQAFFSYFLIEDNYIAARGRGGGLALWVKS